MLEIIFSRLLTVNSFSYRLPLASFITLAVSSVSLYCATLFFVFFTAFYSRDIKVLRTIVAIISSLSAALIASSIEIFSDVQNYQIVYELVDLDDFMSVKTPYGIELVLPSIFSLLSVFNLSFKFVIFFITFISFLLIFLSVGNFFGKNSVLIIFLLLITPPFIYNAPFLMRQFLAMSFLLYFMSLKRKVRFIGLLSFFIHISTFYFLPIFFLRFKLPSYKVLGVGIVICLFLNPSMYSSSLILNLVDKISGGSIFFDALAAKLVYYSFTEIEGPGLYKSEIIFPLFFLIGLFLQSLMSNKNCNEEIFNPIQRRLIFLLLISSFLMLFFRDVANLSYRLGLPSFLMPNLLFFILIFNFFKLKEYSSLRSLFVLSIIFVFGLLLLLQMYRWLWRNDNGTFNILLDPLASSSFFYYINSILSLS